VHVHTFLAFALKQSKELLLFCSPKFCDIVGRIKRKQFSGKKSKIDKELNFDLKTAAKMVNSHMQVYFINETMQAEIDVIQQALKEDSGILFEVPISLSVLVIFTMVKIISLRKPSFLSFILSPYVCTNVECTINSCSILLN
jgi:hypothetical protein